MLDCAAVDLSPAATALLAAATSLVALLYSSVGHGGASGYLAAMALLGVAPETMRPTALLLNVLVSAVASIRFARAGHLSLGLLVPFAAASIPASFVGGGLSVSAPLYRIVLGAVLLFAAWRLVALLAGPEVARGRPTLAPALAIGGAIGLVSGVVGVGGGIFLTPILLIGRWATAREAAAASALFILANSLAGLAGRIRAAGPPPPLVPLLAAAALAGGVFGSGLGARRLPPVTLRRLLAIVLAIAGVKLLMSR